jgi:tetratricopeptide (TPR) repeat protein
MPSPEPSLDPYRTVNHEAQPQPDTVNVSQELSTNAMGPYSPAPFADAPKIPGYRISAEIAKGGMGCVYAGHDLTLDREVAIKTLLPGANAERFITEAKITARLPHPNIPPVHALGTLDDGTPWLTMKFIRGQTLGELLKKRSSPQDDLQRYIQIFEQICQAVGFAHSRGILHRDLKPLNVMVGEFGEVQVMDWGLAKELSGPDRESAETSPEAEDLQHTAAGVIMGTPGYMAPEQARGEVVDTRADVFALGSILAVILTGQPALVGTTVHETIAKAANADLDEVRERVANCGADAELITLAFRCIGAKPDERPADGREVATEVTAYRAGVDARLKQAETDRARAETQAIEQAKRRRVVQGAGGLVAVVLLVGILGTTWGLVEATMAQTAEKRRADAEAEARQEAARERDAKVLALQAETKALAEAEQRRKQAETNLAYAKKGNEILGSIFAGLEPKAIAESGRPLQDVLRQNLVKAVQELEGSSIGDPLEVADVQNTLGLSLLGLGEGKLAIEVFQKALETRKAELGLGHRDTLQSMSNLAESYRTTGQIDKALPLTEQTLKLRNDRLGADHPDTLISMNNLAESYRAAGKLDKALPLLEETVKLSKAKLGPDHPETLTSMNNLAGSYQSAGQLDKAMPLFKETLKLRKAKLGPDHPYTLLSINNLALVFQDADQFNMALPLFEETLTLRKAKLGPDHPDTLQSMNNLAGSYRSVGKLDEAVKLFEETVKLSKAKLGSDHPDTLSSMNNLAASYGDTGKLDKALQLMEETLRLRKAKLGLDHFETLQTMNNLAIVYSQSGYFDKAFPLFEETLKLSKDKLGPDHPDTLNVMGNLGAAYCDAKQGVKAARLLKEFVARRQKHFSKDTPGFIEFVAKVATRLLKCDQFVTAEEMLREALTIGEKTQPNVWTTFNTQSLLGAALLGQKKYADAELLLVKGYEGLKQREKSIPPQASNRVPEAFDRLIHLYTAMNKHNELKKYMELRGK